MTNKRRLAIVGASGHGKVCADIAEQEGYDVTFFDKRYLEIGEKLEHWPVVGNSETLRQSTNDVDAIFIAVGDNNIRLNLLRELSDLDKPFARLIASSATISPYASIAEGSVIMPNAVVNAFAKIEMGVIVNSAAVVEHDCVLKACSHISPNAALAGAAELGECAWLGIGACVKQLVKIGDAAVVGAGAVVVKDIENNLTVVGNPAREKHS